MARLIFIGDKFAGRVYEFAVEKTTVGRGDHNTLTIHDASVSHSHCEILVYGPEVIVRDLGSSNGTFVNGERLVRQQRPLLAGQVVEFGAIAARLELGSSPGSDTVTELTAIHAHARHLCDRPSEPKPPTPAPLTLETGSPAAAADQTLVLVQPPETPGKPKPSSAAAQRARKPSRKLAVALMVAVFVMGLAALLWLMLGKGR